MGVRLNEEVALGQREVSPVVGMAEGEGEPPNGLDVVKPVVGLEEREGKKVIDASPVGDNEGNILPERVFAANEEVGKKEKVEAAVVGWALEEEEIEMDCEATPVVGMGVGENESCTEKVVTSDGESVTETETVPVNE